MSAASAAMLIACAGTPPSDGAVADMKRAPATACADLAGLQLPDTAVTLAEVVAAGTFEDPAATGAGPAGAPPPDFSAMPEFCRVAATVTPAPGSEIKLEVWLPTEGWNGKYAGIGNGGFAGAILYSRLIDPLTRGYVVANTDTGHAGRAQDASFGAGHPEAMIDFAYRAVHEMTLKAKALAEAYYGAPPQRSYWIGCSTGGRQGIESAQRYPNDYDAIVAGAPANNMARLQAHSLLMQIAMTDRIGGLPRAKTAAIHEAALAACDADDGLVDRIISDPERCVFDPGVLACSGAPTDACLTPPEVAAARAIYAGVVDPRTGAQVYPPAQPGSEAQWATFAVEESIGSSFYRNLALHDPDWDYLSFDFDADIDAGLAVAGGAMQSQEPDLSAFFARGGKLVLWHGWSDPLVAPGNTVDYHQSVVDAVGVGAAEDGMRLFMAPGVGHCRGGDGAAPADLLAVLEAWAEQGDAPQTVLGRRAPREDEPQITRPICRYPLVSRYDGAGDPADAASFSCVSPE